jgi:hypothetical protein
MNSLTMIFARSGIVQGTASGARFSSTGATTAGMTSPARFTKSLVRLPHGGPAAVAQFQVRWKFRLLRH